MRRLADSKASSSPEIVEQTILITMADPDPEPERR